MSHTARAAVQWRATGREAAIPDLPVALVRVPWSKYKSPTIRSIACHARVVKRRFKVLSLCYKPLLLYESYNY